MCWSWAHQTDKFAVVGCLGKWMNILRWRTCLCWSLCFALEAAFFAEPEQVKPRMILNISLQKLSLKACMRMMRMSLQCHSMSLLLRSLELVTYQRNLRLFRRDSTSGNFSQTSHFWFFFCWLRRIWSSSLCDGRSTWLVHLLRDTYPYLSLTILLYCYIASECLKGLHSENWLQK